ncbi:MAG: hypothetical protein R3C20_00895 [Planctomycetaceae bacterium]
MSSPDTGNRTSSPAIRISLSPTIRHLLKSVRQRIRRDSAIGGIMVTLVFLGGVFWTSLLLDEGWFALQKMELPVGLRAIALAVLLPVLIWILGSRVLFPLIRRIHDTDLALLLERRFPQFQDRLITSVESQSGFSNDGPLVANMLARAVEETNSIAAAIDPSEVFSTHSIRKSAWLASSVTLAIATVGILQPSTLNRWYDAFVRCEETYHQRTSTLEIYAIAQPGDRKKEFREIEGAMVYRHPRGTDLELELFVPEFNPANNKPWTVPDRIRIDVVREDGSRSRAYISSANDRTFRFVLARLQETIRLEILAGDYRPTHEYRVEPVNVPIIDSIQLRCDFPEYTQWNQKRERVVNISGSEISLPEGTSFELQAAASKPLKSVRIVTERFEISGDRESARIIPREGFASTSLVGGPLVSEDGRSLRIQFSLLTEAATSEADPPTAGALESTSPSADLPSDFFPLVSNTAIRFFLQDEDEVMSINPDVLRVRGIPDEAPVIAVRGEGIENAVTRLARIPITGKITDDYGLQTGHFEFLVDDESTWRLRPFRRPPAPGSLEYQLSRDDDVPFEVFEVQPLDLSEGQTLTLAVTASDSNVMTGPGESRSEPMVFRIVSNEELLSLLYTREIALRRRFEEVISELDQLQQDLNFHQSVASRLENATDRKAEDDAAVTTCATRAGNTLRRQGNELTSIADGFDEIISQLLNNAIPPQQLAMNMRDEILMPIRRVTKTPLSNADRTISEFRVAAMDRKPVTRLISDSAAQVSAMISTLRTILENVRDMAEFHEALRDLKSILEEQQKILDETRALQKRNLIDKLKLLD